MKSIRYPIENVSIFESIFCAFVQAVEYMGRRHGNRLLAGFFQSKKSVCVRYSRLSPWKEKESITILYSTSLLLVAVGILLTIL